MLEISCHGSYIYIETKSMDLSNLSKFLNFNISLKIVFILANSADRDEMPPQAVFNKIYCINMCCMLLSHVSTRINKANHMLLMHGFGTLSIHIPGHYIL